MGSVSGLLVKGDLISNFFNTAAISSFVIPSSLTTERVENVFMH